MTEQARRRVVSALKAALTVALLAWLLNKVKLDELGDRLSHLRATDVVALAVITVVQVTISVVRWWRMLRRLGERVSFRALYGDVLVGLTYNMFLPTTVGGDVVRAWRCRKRVERGHHAWSSSIFERIAGLLAMAASGAIGVAVGLGASTKIPTSVRVAAVAVTVLFVLAFFAASAPFRAVVRLFEKRSPAIEDFRGIVADLEGPLATAGARLEALGWSLLYQAFGILFVVVGARGLGDATHTLEIVVGVPLVHILSMIPVTIGGLGLREGLFVEVLGALGMEKAVAFGLAAQWLASSVGFALAGGIVALSSPSPSQSAARATEKIG